MAKPFCDWDFNELADHISGALILSIGRGDFHGELTRSIITIGSWYDLHNTKMKRSRQGNSNTRTKSRRNR